MQNLPTCCPVCSGEVKYQTIWRGSTANGWTEMGYRCSDDNCGLSVVTCSSDMTRQQCEKIASTIVAGHMWRRLHQHQSR